MGMCCGLTLLSDTNIQHVVDHPPLIWKVLAPEDPEVFEEATRPRQSLLQKLFGQKSPTTTFPELVFSGEELHSTDIDKAWHGIHYLLTGSDWGGEPPLDFILLGGAEIGDIDVGYGPARAFDSARTLQIHSALSAIGNEDLRARYMPEEMQSLDIYPNIWDFDPAEDDAFGYCADYYAEIQKFMARAVAGKLGFVIQIF